VAIRSRFQALTFGLPVSPHLWKWQNEPNFNLCLLACGELFNRLLWTSQPQKRLQLDAARRSYRLPIRRGIIIGKLPGVRDLGENTINKRNCSARNYCRIWANS
jgi:hypothetical protein